MKMNTMIKKLRRDKGLSQEQLSELVGVSLQTIRRWEWGATTPNAKLLSDLAKVLNTTPEYLLSDNPEKNGIQLEDNSTTSHIQTDKPELVYEWGGKNRIALPNTPETLAVFERLVMSALKSSPAAMA